MILRKSKYWDLWEILTRYIRKKEEDEKKRIFEQEAIKLREEQERIEAQQKLLQVGEFVNQIFSQKHFFNVNLSEFFKREFATIFFSIIYGEFVTNFSTTQKHFYTGFVTKILPPHKNIFFSHTENFPPNFFKGRTRSWRTRKTRHWSWKTTQSIIIFPRIFSKNFSGWRSWTKKTW